MQNRGGRCHEPQPSTPNVSDTGLRQHVRHTQDCLGGNARVVRAAATDPVVLGARLDVCGTLGHDPPGRT